MGKLVKKISLLRLKSLFIISVFLLFNNFAFSQNNTQNDNASSEQTSVVSSLENDANYFSDSPAAVTTGSANSNYKAPSTAGMIIKMLVVLALVIAGLYAILRFIKKKNNNVQSDDDFMRRVSSLNFAPGKSVEIVTLVDRCFMLGVTDSNINLIAEITDKEMISAMNLNFDKKQNTKKPMNFNDVLEMFMPGSARNRQNIYSNTERAVDNLAKNSQEEENGETENQNEES